METLILRHRARRLMRLAVFAKKESVAEYTQLRFRARKLWELARQVNAITTQE